MAKPFTFHMQIKEDILSQNRAEDFRNLFSKTEIAKALDSSGIIHFGRTVLIPNDRITPGTKGTFALQVVLVYDGQLEDLITWFCKTKILREIFVGLSEIGKVPCKNTESFSDLFDYLFENNINRTERELHKGHPLSVKEIRALFRQPSPRPNPDGKIPFRLSNRQFLRV